MMMKGLIIHPIAILLIILTACTKNETPTITIGDLSKSDTELNIRHFWVAGPFKINITDYKYDNDAIQLDYTSYWGHKENQLSLSGIKSLISSDRLSPLLDANYINELYQSKEEYINLNKVFDVEDYTGNCYAACNVNSKIEQDVAILTGCDDGIKIWANNKLIKQKVERSGTKRNNIIVSAHLKKGNNLIVVKILNIKGNWSFYLNLSSLKYVHDLYLNKIAGNFLSTCLIDYDSLNLSVYKPFFQNIGMINASIKNSKGNTLLTRNLQFQNDDFSFQFQRLEANNPYKMDITIGNDTISQMFFYGDTSKFLEKCRNIANHIQNPLQRNNLNTLFYRYNFLKSYGEMNGYDEYMKRKLVFVLYELDQITYDLKNNREAYKHIPGLHLRSFISKIDGQTQDYQVYIPKHYNKSRPLPMVIEMPWISETQRPFLESWHVADLNRVNMVSRLADKFGFAYLWPNSRIYSTVNYTSITTQATFEAIDAVKENYTIDTSRLYLYGVCWGGANALIMAERFPGKFAAAALEGPLLADFPNDTLKTNEWFSKINPFRYIENFIQFPLFIVHSTIDEKSPFKPTLDLVNEIRKAKGNVRFKSPKISKNLTVDFYPEEQYLDEFFQFFSSRKRNFSPDSIIFTTNENKYNTSGTWVTIRQIKSNEKALLKASVKDNTIRLNSNNITALTVYPSRIIQLDTIRNVKIYFNHRIVFDSVFTNNAIEIGNRNYFNQKDCFTEGPLNHFFCNSFILVRGTKGTQANNTDISNCAEWFNHLWNQDFYSICKEIEDSKISNNEIINNNLLLIGDETSNSVLQKIYKDLPVKCDANSIQIGKEKYSGNNLGIAFIYPNPFNKQKYILVVTGNNSKILYNVASSFWHNGYYDYVVIDSKENNIIGYGYFNAFWQ